MTVKAKLHRLVDALPASEVAAAQRYLEYLRDLGSDPVLRALAAAPFDDEPLTNVATRAIAVARSEIARGKARPLRPRRPRRR
jgi:hypothetical protein